MALISNQALRAGLLAFAIALSGCAAPRDAATELANAGTAATATISAKIVQTADRVERIVPLFCMAMAVQGGGEATCNEFRKTAEPAILQLADGVRAGKVAVAALSKSYADFLALAAEDKKAVWSESAKTLLGSVDVYLEAFGLAPLSKPLVIGGSALAGFIGEQQQRADILDANATIQVALDGLAKGMRAEQEAFNGILGYATLAETTARTVMLQQKLADPNAVIKAFLSDLGMTANPKLDVAKNQAHLAGAINAATLAAGKDLRHEQAAYDASIGALEALSAQHSALAADQGLSITGILGRINELAALIKAIKASEKADQTTAAEGGS